MKSTTWIWRQHGNIIRHLQLSNQVGNHNSFHLQDLVYDSWLLYVTFIFNIKLLFTQYFDWWRHLLFIYVIFLMCTILHLRYFHSMSNHICLECQFLQSDMTFNQSTSRSGFITVKNNLDFYPDLSGFLKNLLLDNFLKNK